MEKIDFQEIVLSKYSSQVIEYVENVSCKLIKHPLLISIDHLSTDILEGKELFKVLDNHTIYSVSTSFSNAFYVIMEDARSDFKPLVEAVCFSIMPTGDAVERLLSDLEDEYKDVAIVEGLIIVMSYLDLITNGTVFICIPLSTILNRSQFR